MTDRPRPSAVPQTTVHTVGHGNRASEELIELLRDAAIVRLVDVRAHPGSRRHPQFSQAALQRDLAAAGIRYVWEGRALGGRRRPRPDSPNGALRNESFRAYADHMRTPAFVAAAHDLMDEASRESTAIMCAERLYWQCHRSLISDYLVAHGVRVVHLIGIGSVREHTLHPVARIDDGLLLYDRTEQQELDLSDTGKSP